MWTIIINTPQIPLPKNKIWNLRYGSKSQLYLSVTKLVNDRAKIRNLAWLFKNLTQFSYHVFINASFYFSFKLIVLNLEQFSLYTHPRRLWTMLKDIFGY